MKKTRKNTRTSNRLKKEEDDMLCRSCGNAYIAMGGLCEDCLSLNPFAAYFDFN